MENKKEHLAKLFLCRQYLQVHGMLTESINNHIHMKIVKYQEKNKINITEKELENVEFITLE